MASIAILTKQEGKFDLDDIDPARYYDGTANRQVALKIWYQKPKKCSGVSYHDRCPY
jgi:hypothetical protein